MHDQVLAQIRRSALELQYIFSKPIMSKTLPETNWRDPNPDVIELNIDGSFLASNVYLFLEMII